ncbi:hypothetical protein DFH08DRAFT_842105 [Mycena albidolilacea]|uniref:Uncharacterized protein n=1 Tax=Mycena albidolilacea TaxID=1033008 RepID=A0AAD7AJA8_9AGAR|nr:hypothetical protein DFH08DRAFT_842105 [Mycena albidolilacea]
MPCRRWHEHARQHPYIHLLAPSTTWPFVGVLEFHFTTILTAPTDYRKYHRTSPGFGVIMVAEDSEIGVRHTSGLRRLSLELRCPSLYRLFIRPQHLSFTSGLTHLGIHTSNGNRGDGENAKLIFNASRTLQSLHIQTESASDRITSPLPPFPALRFLQYDLPILALGHPWFVENLRGFLAPESSPRLDGIIVIFHLGDGAAINGGTLNMLDAAIEAHPAHPYLGFRWHSDLSSRLPSRYLDTFVHMIHRAMPRALTSGRLAIEHV